jgi:glyoxylase-like metal-dependent hydrolase (beta-lactamase superfamily II)
MRMHLLSGGRLQMPRRVYFPDAVGREMFDLPVSCALFRHAQGNALFDTGCHPDAAVDADARWGLNAAYSPPVFAPEDAVIGQLHLAGLQASDVDLVICSHLHYDHCGCNAFFDRATMICHARELDAARAKNAVPQGYHANDWDVGLPIETINGEHDVFGDGRLTLIPLPGHTPGMMGAHVVLDRDGVFLVASDAVPIAVSLHQRFVPVNTVDRDLFLESLDRVAGFERDGATILFGHDDAQWRSLRTGPEFYA